MARVAVPKGLDSTHCTMGDASLSALSAADASFLLLETAASPLHVAGLMLFELPPRAGDNYHRNLYAKMRRFRKSAPPFSKRVRIQRFSMPQWEVATDFDIAQHLFLHTLPSPGRREQLYKLVAKLHESLMDRSRPLWEFHVIGGLSKRRFAVYCKIHHAYADGVTMGSWMTGSMSASARDRTLTPIWTQRHGDSVVGGSNEFNVVESVGALLGRPTEALATARGLSRIGSQLLLERLGMTRNAIAIPFTAPANTPLNGRLTADRQVATAAVPMDRVGRIRRAARASLNHVALSCVDEALHRYLEDLGCPLTEPIVIAMPVSLRDRNRSGTDLGNEVCMVLVELAEETDDPYKRMRDIGVKLRYVRLQVDGQTPQAMLGYSMLTGFAAQAIESLGLADQIRPMANTLVSNVAGPKETLYLHGARLLEHYPLSAIGGGQQLNITLYSYDKHLHFGLVATKRLGDLRKLGEYIYEAFVNLEQAVLDPLNAGGAGRQGDSR